MKTKAEILKSARVSEKLAIGTGSDMYWQIAMLLYIWYHALNKPKSRAALDDVLAEIAYLG